MSTVTNLAAGEIQPELDIAKSGKLLNLVACKISFKKAGVIRLGLAADRSSGEEELLV